MDDDESIKDMFTRFNKITNDLNSYGKSYPSEDLVKKILRSLNEKWLPKVTAIKEAKELSALSIEDLISSLMTHELELMPKKEDKSKSKIFTLKAESNDSDCDVPEDELAFVAKKFIREYKK